MLCPNCQQSILPDDINIKSDIAMCRTCNKVYSVSHDLMDREYKGGSGGRNIFVENELDNFDITNPPDNKTWVRQTSQGISIGAYARSAFSFFFLIFLLVFGGISTTVFGSLFFTGALETDMLLFFIPFFLVDLIMLCLFLFTFFGKVEITIDRYDGEVFIGAFSLGWRKHFDVKNVKNIYEDVSNVRVNNVPKLHVIMELDSGKITFGSMLKNERRKFIYLALKKYFYQLNQKLGN